MKTGLEDSLDLLSQEIIESDIVPKDICYIIAEYAINLLKVDKFTEKVAEIYLNNVYISEEDYSPNIKYLKFGYDIYQVKPLSGVKKGRIIFNGVQRDYLRIRVNNNIQGLFLENDLGINELSEIRFIIKVVRRDILPKIDTKIIVDILNGQILTIKQDILLKIYESEIVFKVQYLKQNKKHKYSIIGDYNGKLTENTVIKII